MLHVDYDIPQLNEESSPVILVLLLPDSKHDGKIWFCALHVQVPKRGPKYFPIKWVPFT